MAWMKGCSTFWKISAAGAGKIEDAMRRCRSRISGRILPMPREKVWILPLVDVRISWSSEGVWLVYQTILA
ncbi:MAG: hypothetical protein CL912_32020 [Deltaproteobacteria bacterium]|nr:hypothetical protein [Deltaproteobacteria bacterium]